MTLNSQGEKLIFLISQPRAGSTMLQRVLASHPDIHTMAEPWLMLHPLYALRSTGNTAEYNARLAASALQDFIRELPNGEDDYLDSVRLMCGHLYARALASSGKTFFLDKTPRYYFIIGELHRLFPHSNPIILLRNPLAVLCSILSTWVKGNWPLLRQYRHDLVLGPRLLLDGIQRLGEDAIVVCYEQVVGSPEQEVERLCGRIGIDFLPEMVEYGRQNLPRWRLGDPSAVYRQSRPDVHNADKWIAMMEDPQVWRLANDYLRLLGPNTIDQMGYSYSELEQLVEGYRPAWRRSRLTIPLSWLIGNPVEDRNDWSSHLMPALGSFRQRGVFGTAMAGGRRLVNALPNTR